MKNVFLVLLLVIVGILSSAGTAVYYQNKIQNISEDIVSREVSLMSQASSRNTPCKKLAGSDGWVVEEFDTFSLFWKRSETGSSISKVVVDNRGLSVVDVVEAACKEIATGQLELSKPESSEIAGVSGLVKNFDAFCLLVKEANELNVESRKTTIYILDEIRHRGISKEVGETFEAIAQVNPEERYKIFRESVSQGLGINWECEHLDKYLRSPQKVNL